MLPLLETSGRINLGTFFAKKYIDIPAQRKTAIRATIMPISPIGDHKDKRQLIFAHLQPKASHFW